MYLNETSHFVSVGDKISDLKFMTCGVPLGSVLGPLLFLSYINDFNNSATDVHFHLFVDGSNLCFSHESLHCLQTKLKNHLHNQ